MVCRAGQQAQGSATSASPVLRLQAQAAMPSFSVSAGDPELKVFAVAWQAFYSVRHLTEMTLSDTMRRYIPGYQEDEAAYTWVPGDVCLCLFNAMPASQWNDSFFFSSFQMWVFFIRSFVSFISGFLLGNNLSHCIWNLRRAPRYGT